MLSRRGFFDGMDIYGFSVEANSINSRNTQKLKNPKRNDATHSAKRLQELHGCGVQDFL